MALYTVDLATVTIPNGASTSNAISLVEDAYGIGILAPATITASQVTIQVAQSASTSATFATLQSGGSDITLTASKALIMSPFPWRQLRIISSSVEGQADAFGVTKMFIT